MTRKYTALTFTDSVKAAQTDFGARKTADKVAAWDIDDETLTDRESSFISQRDSFYMATVNDDGWPYVQFRGGPVGFLKALEGNRLAYADLRGNRQYISTGNLRANDRVALFFMDYPNRMRLKVMAHATVYRAEDHPDLVAELDETEVRAPIERVVHFRVAAFDWNCPQHITPRYTLDEWPDVMGTAE